MVAINTAIIPFAHGIGFATPINSAKKCTNEIIAHGGIIRPWLGVSGLTVTREVASYYGLPIDRGVLVTRVIPGSPADNGQTEKVGILILRTLRDGLSKRSCRELRE